MFYEMYFQLRNSEKSKHSRGRSHSLPVIAEKPASDTECGGLCTRECFDEMKPPLYSGNLFKGTGIKPKWRRSVSLINSTKQSRSMEKIAEAWYQRNSYRENGVKPSFSGNVPIFQRSKEQTKVSGARMSDSDTIVLKILNKSNLSYFDQLYIKKLRRRWKTSPSKTINLQLRKQPSGDRASTERDELSRSPRSSSSHSVPSEGESMYAASLQSSVTSESFKSTKPLVGSLHNSKIRDLKHNSDQETASSSLHLQSSSKPPTPIPKEGSSIIGKQGDLRKQVLMPQSADPPPYTAAAPQQLTLQSQKIPAANGITKKTASIQSSIVGGVKAATNSSNHKPPMVNGSKAPPPKKSVSISESGHRTSSEGPGVPGSNEPKTPKQMSLDIEVQRSDSADKKFLNSESKASSDSTGFCWACKLTAQGDDEWKLLDSELREKNPHYLVHACGKQDRKLGSPVDHDLKEIGVLTGPQRPPHGTSSKEGSEHPDFRQNDEWALLEEEIHDPEHFAVPGTVPSTGKASSGSSNSTQIKAWGGDRIGSEDDRLTEDDLTDDEDKTRSRLGTLPSHPSMEGSLLSLQKTPNHLPRRPFFLNNADLSDNETELAAVPPANLSIEEEEEETIKIVTEKDSSRKKKQNSFPPDSSSIPTLQRPTLASTDEEEVKMDATPSEEVGETDSEIEATRLASRFSRHSRLHSLSDTKEDDETAVKFCAEELMKPQESRKVQAEMMRGLIDSKQSSMDFNEVNLQRSGFSSGSVSPEGSPTKSQNERENRIRAMRVSKRPTLGASFLGSLEDPDFVATDRVVPKVGDETLFLKKAHVGTYSVSEAKLKEAKAVAASGKSPKKTRKSIKKQHSTTVEPAGAPNLPKPPPTGLAPRAKTISSRNKSKSPSRIEPPRSVKHTKSVPGH